MHRVPFTVYMLFEVLVSLVLPYSVDNSSNENISIENNLLICEPTNQEICNETIWWGNETKSNAQWYISQPLCLNKNYTFSERFCYNGTWDSEPDCYTLQRAITPCPDGLIYYEAKEICYTILTNQTFPYTCPYRNVVSFYDFATLIGKEIPSPIWFPAKRDVDYGIGHMVMVEPTQYYGDIVSINYHWKESFNRNCIIAHSVLSYENTRCSSTYNAACVYRPLNKLQNNYCRRNMDKSCYSNDYNISESKCICLRSGDESCNILAELKKPFQNFIIPTGRKGCRIGLEFDDNFIWTYSRENLDYTNWDKNTNFDNKFGFLKKSFWILKQETENNCKLCQEDITYHQPKLSLAYDTKTHQLILTVDNPKDLYVPEETTNALFCFTDATSRGLIIKTSTYNTYEVINDTRVIYYFFFDSDHPGYYWCQAFSYPELDLISTDKILVYDEEVYGNEFATTLIVEYNDSVNPTLPEFFTSLDNAIDSHLAKNIGDNVPFFLRWVTIVEINETAQTAEYLLHITSKDFTDVETEHKIFKTQLNSAVSNISEVLEMTNLRSVSYCLPENTTSNNIILSWPLTKLNNTVTPEEFCLLSDGTPVTRTCSGDFLVGAKWLNVQGKCAAHPYQSVVTAALYELVQSNKPLKDISDYLARMTTDVHDYLPVDIHYIAEIFEKSDKGNVSSIDNITTVIHNILSTSKTPLLNSQTLLNSTDKILYNFDLLLEKFYKEQITRSFDIVQIETKNLLVYVYDAKSSDITGIAIYNTSGEILIKPLTGRVEYYDLFEKENFAVATVIPIDLLEQISETLEDNEPLIVVITVFLNDYLFNEKYSNSGNPYHSIIGILLPDIEDTYVDTIKVIYNISASNEEEHCAYWHYGTGSDLINMKGEWEFQNEPIIYSDIRVCSFSHTTHFALLILADVSINEQECYERHNFILHVITTVECSLSITGLVCVFITGILFRRWRQNKGNQILLQYSIVTLLQIILLYISNFIRSSGITGTVCILIGACLHYIVLSQFCWMLVMAVLHYQRFVLVFAKPQQWVLLKSCILGYMFPTVPVIINMCISVDSYVLGNTGMCYPTGKSFTLSLMFPILGIAIVNMIIFCIIIWNIFVEKFDNIYGHDYIFVLKFRLVLVLFSLLGITWVFGFGAEFFGSIVFAYVFTISVSIQGFIMFLTFIALNENTRNMYLIYFLKSCKYRKW